MARRVSLKGKGADIFFGEYEAPASASPLTPPAGDALAAEPSQPSSPRSHTSKKASMQESKHARKQVTAELGQSSTALPSAEAISAVWQQLCERATITNAFRYTDRELAGLSDALYQLAKQYGIKLTKQDVARLGLDVVLWDYQAHGDQSLLGEFALRKKRQNGEEV